MISFETLKQFLHALTPVEKAQFKTKIKKKHDKKHLLYMEIFDLLLKEEQLDEFYFKSNYKDWTAKKHYLIDLILESLIPLLGGQTFAIRTPIDLSKLNVLIVKKRFELAQDYAYSILKSCISSNSLSLCLPILKSLSVTQSVFKQTIPSKTLGLFRAKTLSEAYSTITHNEVLQLQLSELLELLNAHLSQKYNDTFNIDDWIEPKIKAALLNKRNDALTPMIHIIKLNTKSFYYEFKFEYQLGFKILQEVYEALEQQAPTFMQTENKISTLHNILKNRSLVNDLEHISYYLNKVNTFTSEQKEVHKSTFQFIELYYHLFLTFKRDGAFPAFNLMSNSEFGERYYSYMKTTHKNRYMYCFALNFVIFLHTKNYKLCAKQYSEVLELIHSTNSPIHFYVLAIMYLFESKKFDLLESLINTLKKKAHHHGLDKNVFVQLMIRIFHQIHEDNQERKLKKYHTEVENLYQEHPYKLPNVFGLVDFKAWYKNQLMDFVSK